MTAYLKCIIVAIIFMGFLHSPARALTNEEVFSQFQFNFITPGARATALGGAFIGLADDATAVEANPAGLTVLTAPEMFAEFRHITYTAEHIYANPLSLEGVDWETGIVLSDIIKKEFDDFVTSVPFVSVVYPYKGISFSLYRQELVNYTHSFQTSDAWIGITGTSISSMLPPIKAAIDLRIINYGIGAAVRIQDRLSLAFSPRWSEIEMDANTTYYAGGDVVHGTVYGTGFSDEYMSGKAKFDDVDYSFCVNVGMLLTLHPKLSLGAVYKSGPTFEITGSDYGTAYNLDLLEFTLKVPDVYGVGGAFRVTEFLTVTLDVIYIRYEDLLKDFDIGMQRNIYTPDNYTVDNVTELHVGLEYLLPYKEHFLALRAGLYTNPDHTIRFTGTTEDVSSDKPEREQFPGGEDQIHMTCGMGIILNDRFQIDTAANLAKYTKQFSLSAIYRF